VKLSAPPPPPPEPPEPPEPNKDGGPAGEPTPGAPDAEASTPSPAAAPRPVAWPGWFAGVDAALAVLAVTLGFLLASFAARNSDLWLHLAAGKRLVAGEYRFGSDPFSYTAADRVWVNHSWLFDLGAYLLYGGAGFVLVFVKALAVAAAAALLLAIRRPAFPLWPWTICVTLALLSAAPRLQLQPYTASFLMLALTLFLVFRLPSPPGSWRLPVAVGATFWFWANLDSWFVLGPLTLGLLLLGEAVQRYALRRADGADAGPDPLGLPDASTLARALLVGIAACMLNPHHVRVWELPFEVAGSEAAAADPLFKQSLLVSPLDDSYREWPQLGANPSGLSYAVLLIGGGLVVGIGAARVRLANLALWLGFAALSLRTTYAIPFFAAVAAPLVAAELNALSARVRSGTWADPRTRFLLLGSAAGRVLSVLGLVALCALAWPGWLHPVQGTPADTRRVAWAVEPDPALVRAAGQFREWRESGSLPADAKGLIASPDLANYCAWYAPREKVFLNSRFNHHRVELPEFVAARAALGLTRAQGADDSPRPVQVAEVLTRHGAEYLGFHDRLRRNGLTATLRLWEDPGSWSTWYLDGRTVVAGWRAPGAAGSRTFDRLRVNPVVSAFGPRVERVPPGSVQPPPPERDWAADFLRPVRPAPPEADEALGWLDYKQALRARQARLYQLALGFHRNVPGVPVPLHGPGLVQEVAEAQVLAGAEPFVPEPGDGSFPALPVLAVRAARRAIAANPDHPDGYFALARALADRHLPLNETERALGQVTAYRQCLDRFPPPAEFGQLVETYRRNVYAASPTLVARELARLYLGPRRPDGQPTGMPIEASPLPELAGLVVPDGRGGLGRMRFCPLDLARQVLVAANDYAAVEFTREGPEFRKALAEELAGFQKQVDEVLRPTYNRYRDSVDRTTRVAERYQLARQFDQVGEAIRTLREADLNREFDKAAPQMQLQLVALLLCVGRLDDAARELEAVRSYEDLARQLGGDPEALTQFRFLTRYLDYHKLVLEGNYPAAGAELETLEGRVVGADPLAGIPPELKPAGHTALRGAWPIVGMLAADAPLGVITGYWAGLIQQRQFEYVQQVIAQRLDAEANFFFRRGFLSLLEGDIPAAKERFRQAVRDPPPGWGLSRRGNRFAVAYLQLIEAAERERQ
jgi:hypothetical protein